VTAESAATTEIRGRLLRLARQRAEDFQLILIQYGLERLLYRLGRSQYAGTFVLKGAMLFPLWDEALHRPTRDLDLLGYGESNIEQLEEAIRAICEVEVEIDGLRFDTTTIRTAVIREGQQYEGIRLRFQAYLGATRIPIHIDIGFGDVVVPEARMVTYPTLLNLPAPVIRAYPAETVVAEKYQALVDLGSTNSRMKDFYDLWMLARTMRFDGATLTAAIGATFARRGTALPHGTPVGLTAEWAAEDRVVGYWLGFVGRNDIPGEAPLLTAVVALLRGFLQPPTAALLAGESFVMQWPAGGPWTA
jgi:predicted nucleotidyltransferase component of viral defense system